MISSTACTAAFAVQGGCVLPMVWNCGMTSVCMVLQMLNIAMSLIMTVVLGCCCLLRSMWKYMSHTPVVSMLHGTLCFVHLAVFRA